MRLVSRPSTSNIMMVNTDNTKQRVFDPEFCVFARHDRVIEVGILGPAVEVLGGVLRRPPDLDQRRVRGQG